MLSPATFIGIAKAVPPPAEAIPAGPGSIQPARVSPTPPVAAPVTPLPTPLATPRSVTVSPSQPATPPRNLPRGSLLDISV